VRAAKKALVPENYIARVIQFARQGYKEIEFKTYDTDWDSEAYLTVSGQNSNNSVSITDDFLRSVEQDGDWDLIERDQDRQSPQDGEEPAIFGKRSAMPPGHPLIQVCTSTPP
jgi:ribonucleoside-diphosphate reductase alpha chain